MADQTFYRGDTMRRFCWFLTMTAAALTGNASMAGASPTQMAVTGTTIDPGLGTLHHAVSTQSEQAQKFFDQGLTLNYALNHEAAVQSYRRALELDPDLAMAYWGIAHAMGPDINQPMTSEHLAAANEAIAKAVALAPHASLREREYIEALRKRYSVNEPADRSSLDIAYEHAMAALSAHAPEDVDAAVLYAESLMILHAWKWWRTDGAPEEGTLEAVGALQRALRLQPNHIGANHYYVHAVEMSAHPEAGLVAAHRLETLAPSAGHLVHMPAHIYMRTGEYLDAARVNESAASADEHVHALGPKSEYLPYYHGHNLHFLAVSYSYAGAGDKAMAAAVKLVETVQGDFSSLPEIIDYYCSNQFEVRVLFDRWAEVLRLPEPPATMPRSRAFYHFAQSLAFAGTGRPVQAQAERTGFIAAASAMEPQESYGNNSAADVMAVALHYLDGRFAMMAGDFKTAAANFRQAANAEEKLAYNEPPDWYLASNWLLGTALMKLGDSAGAEAAFRSDLKHNIGHGRSLAGLAAALRKQGKAAEADATQKRYEYAWRGADTGTPGR